MITYNLRNTQCNLWNIHKKTHENIFSFILSSTSVLSFYFITLQTIMQNCLAHMWESGHRVLLFQPFTETDDKANFRRGCMRKALGESFKSTHLVVQCIFRNTKHNSFSLYIYLAYIYICSPFPFFQAVGMILS